MRKDTSASDSADLDSFVYICQFAIRHIAYPKARNIFVVISRTFHDARDTIIELRIKALRVR